MKLLVECPQCRAVEERRAALQVAGEEPRPAGLHDVQLEAGEVFHDRIEVTCSAGHVQEVPLPVSPHQVLFEYGLWALADGYYRDAVGNAATAVERFREWSMRLLMTQKGISKEVISSWWKGVASRSELQEGGFVATWILVFGAVPDVPKKLRELRNECVHKGRIPRRNDALAYLGWAYRHMAEGEISVRDQFNSLSNFLEVERDVGGLGSTADNLILFVDRNALAQWRIQEQTEIDARYDSGYSKAEEQGRGAEFEREPDPRSCPNQVRQWLANTPIEEVFKLSQLLRSAQRSITKVQRTTR